MHAAIQISASFTAEPLLRPLEQWLKVTGIKPSVALSSYNQIFAEALDPNSASGRNSKGCNVFLIRLSDLAEANRLPEAAATLASAIKDLAARCDAQHQIVFCPEPELHPDTLKLELELISEWSALANVEPYCSAQWGEDYLVRDMFDPESDAAASIPYSGSMFTAIAALITRRLCKRILPTAKVLVLDADNTIWGGICGEESPNTLDFSGAYAELRTFALRKRKEGVLLALCSKNIQADVDRVFAEQPCSLGIRREDFSGWKVSWAPKSQSLRELASELNLGLDSFVFLDDNPAEIAEVRANCPAVLALTIPEDGDERSFFLRHLWALDGGSATDEDKLRAGFYASEAERMQLRARSSTFHDFLRGIGLEIQIRDSTIEDLPRLSQLTKRTNQFNANGLRLTEADLTARRADGATCLTVRVRDRFGDYGLVGAILCRPHAETLSIELFILSCRALGKGVERSMLIELAKRAQSIGAGTLAFSYRASDRNEPFLRFLRATGAEQTASDTFQIAASLAASLSPLPPEDAVLAPATAAPVCPQERADMPIDVAEQIAGKWWDVELFFDTFCAPRRPRPELSQPLTPPGTATQERLAAIWRRVLGLDSVGIHDSFTELGGTSVLLVALHSAIRTELQVAIELTDLFELPTIAKQAAMLEGKGASSNLAAPVRSRIHPPEQDAVAIIGMALRVPGANDPQQFWDNLANGVESISRFQHEELYDPENFGKPGYVPAKGLISGVDLFDAAFFGILPKDAKIMDPQQRIFLELAWEAMERAGYTPDSHSQRIGVYAGAYFDTYLLANLCTDRQFLAELIPSIQVGSLQTELGNDKDYLATRIAYKLNLRGPAMTLQTACSTSMVAVVEACRAIRSGLCDMALAGGVTVTLPLKRGYFHTTEGMLSADGHCRAFDAEATGTVFANGAGVVMLKRLSDARRDGDHIHAVIRGTGLNNDGGVKHSYTAPSVEGQVDVIRMAQQDAQVTPESIGYIEAHGTGTPLGDPIEVNALTKAFRAGGAEENGFCAIGSLKTNIGHLDVASGVCGLIKTALCLEKQALPPTLHFRAPNPKIDFASSPFRVNAKLTPWTEGLRGNPRRAAVSSFGVGGTNAHVILEEAPSLTSSPSVRPNQLFLFSARSPESLSSATTNMAQFAQAPGSIEAADAAWTLAIGRKPFRYRRAIASPDFASLVQALQTDATVSGEAIRENPPVTFLFPGQGAQHVNMGRVFYDTEPGFRRRVDQCSDLLRPYLGLELTTILYPANGSSPEEANRQLKNTVLAQPAIFTVSYALGSLLMDWGIRPAAMIGHSVGEFVAATLSGVFDLEPALRLLATRGRLMGELPAGGMLSVRLSEADLLNRLPSSLDLAAVNGPSLCVVAGSPPELDMLRASLEADGVAVQPLHTSHAFHSRMMDPVVPTFADAFNGISLRAPEIPILSTVTGEWLTARETCDPQYWASHLREPVRFHRAVVRASTAQPGQIFFETGPGQSLTGLVRQSIERQAGHVTVSTCRHLKEQGCDHEHLLQSIGRLWTCGVQIDWNAFYAAEQRRRVTVPTYPFERKRHWVDARPLHSDSFPTLPSSEPIMSPSPSTSRIPQLATAVRGILTDLSGIPTAELVGNASFLELGFDSLLLTQVSKALQNQFQTPITLRQMMTELPSIDAMVAHLDWVLPIEAFRPVPCPPVLAPSQAATSQTPTAPPSVVAPPDASLPAASSHLESVIAQQLDLMRQQLVLLQGLPSAPPQPAPVSATPPVVTAPAPVSAPCTAINRNLDDSLTSRQRRHLDDLIAKYVAKTRTSKELTAKYRRWHADPRTVSGFNRRWKEMIYQIAVVRSKGSRLFDVDGNEYIDLLNGFGPNFLGHSPDFVTEALHAQLDRGVEVGPQSISAMEAAQLFCEVTGNERASFVNTGSEAVQAAMRLARTVTGRDKIVVFARDYHGNFDEVLVKGAGSGDQLRSLPIAPGIPRRAVEDVIVLPYGTEEALNVIRRRAHELAAVIVEPIQSRRPEFQPREFIRELRQITEASGTVFVFDEVITGFRTGPRGAQELYGVTADIATYGKVVGGGMPLGVVAGKAEFMDTFDGGMWNYGDDSFPEKGVTFFAGTFVRHPLAMAAVKAVLQHLRGQGPEFWTQIRERADRLAQSVDRMFVESGAPLRMPNFGSQMFVRAIDEHKYTNLLFFHLRHKGVFLLEGFPSYLTAAHTDEDVDYVISAFRESVTELQHGGFFEPAPGTEPLYQNGSRPNTPEPAPQIHPLTEPLAEVWLASQMGEAASLCFNEINAIRLSGALNTQALEHAITDLVKRHDALRSTFLPSGVGFLTKPVDSFSFRLSIETRTSIEAILDRERSTPFDLVNGPLLRAVLVQQAADEHVLILNAHHLACDGWSYNTLLRELGECYNSRCARRQPTLPAPPSFAAYVNAAKHRESQEGQDTAYWLSQFAVPVAPLRLPTDFPAPRETSFRSASVAYNLGKGDLMELKRCAAQASATLFSLLLGTYQLLLHRISRQQRFAVWFPAAGQSGTDQEFLVGHCVNAIPLISDIDLSQDFTSYVRTTQDRLLDALEHKGTTYGRLLKDLSPDRRPLLEAVFNFERMDVEVPMTGLQTAIREVERKFSTHPLFLKTCETPEGLEVRFDFHEAIYDRATIQAWLDTYRAMLDTARSHPVLPLATVLSAISPIHRHQIQSWNQTGTEFPGERILPELFAEAVIRWPDAIALRCEDRDVTYAELNDLSGRMAHALIDAQVPSGARVALFLERSPELYAAILGILKVGGVYVPIDTQYPADRIQFLLEDSASSVVISQASLMPRLPAGVPVLSVQDALQRTGTELTLRHAKTTPESDAVLIYTSGSTGQPKGALLPHRAVVRLVFGANYAQYDPGQTQMQAASICFDVSLCEVFGSLLHGGRLVIPPAGHRTIDELADLILREHVTQLFLTAALFEALADGRPDAFRSLQRVLTGGDVASLSHVAKIHEAHPHCQIVNSYGPTENTTFTTFHPIAFPDLSRSRLPIGRPVSNSTAWIVDDRGALCPPGIPGELWAGGEGIANGYWNRPGLTDSHFLPDPFTSSAITPVYRTGDLCRFLADGRIEFLGRIDQQVKIRGFRVEPEEVEAHLDRHPSVRQCKITVRGHGAGGRFLAAYLSLHPGKSDTPANFAEYLRSKLPSYMVPSAITVLPELPLTANGKINIHSLPEPSLIPLPDKTEEELTPAEATLLPLWNEVLGLSNTDLDADFFASGGHSLLGMRLLSSIQKNFGIALPLGKLFQAPTIRQLAKEFELQQQSAPLPAPPRSPRHLPWEKGVLNS